MKNKFFLVVPLLFLPLLSGAQNEKSNPSIDPGLGTDIVSRYVWRGLSLSSSPNIQPYMDFSFKNFSFGAWASYAIGEKYAEIDFYLSYSNNGFSLTLNDYYTEDESDFSLTDHFNWKSNTTPHALEGVVGYTLQGTIPLSFSAATIFYGNDQDAEGNNYYSTYLELSYPFAIKDLNFRAYIGGTPFEGIYAENPNVINLGLRGTKEIRITENFSLPVSCSIISNPSAEDVFVVASLSL
jgi:hypothetical protein